MYAREGDHKVYEMQMGGDKKICLCVYMWMGPKYFRTSTIESNEVRQFHPDPTSEPSLS